MKVSILITTYNLEQYIRQTLDSVINQETDFAFEILVGDDGSKDKTVSIIKEYQEKDDRISLYQMPREEGVSYNLVERSSANRINLLRHAKGEYISFLDGDDYYLDSKRIQTLAALLDAEENKDCIMAAHNLFLAYGENMVPLLRAKKRHKFSLEEYWPLCFLQANSILARNIWKDNLPEGPLASFFDDNNITYALFQKGKMYYIPDCMGAYRQVEGSSWNANDERKQMASNTLGFGLEQIVAPEKRNLSDIRHSMQIEYMMTHKSTSDLLEPFYSAARKYHEKEDVLFKDTLELYHFDELGEAEKTSWKKRLKKAKRGYQKAKIKRALAKLRKTY